MKKFLPFLILFILAMLIWDAMFDPYSMSLHINEADFDGPAGTLFGALLAGGGILIGFIVLVVVAVVLAVVFAGVGIVALAAVVLAAVITALALSPLLLPLLIPVAIIWYLASRSRQRQHSLKDHTVVNA
jgi:hypothetical protein